MKTLVLALVILLTVVSIALAGMELHGAILGSFSTSGGTSGTTPSSNAILWNGNSVLYNGEEMLWSGG